MAFSFFRAVTKALQGSQCYNKNAAHKLQTHSDVKLLKGLGRARTVNHGHKFFHVQEYCAPRESMKGYPSIWVERSLSLEIKVKA